MAKHISVIVPNRNGGATIGKCLEAVFASDYGNYDVVVVDDSSDDDSIEIIKKFPCTLLRLEKHSGASKARNAGANSNNADIFFFTDSDCLLEKDALSAACGSIEQGGPEVVVGGTYTKTPYDNGFFSRFQSAFINYSELRNARNPDYVAAHAMAIDAGTFKKNGGFKEEFLPILEDVELSHRLRKAGCRLVMNPGVLVRHIFNFTLLKSIGNALRKSFYWTIYSIKNRDLLSDSGTASEGLKVNVAALCLTVLLLLLFVYFKEGPILYALPAILGFNLIFNAKFLISLFEGEDTIFAITALVYYLTLFAAAVAAGAGAGALGYFFSSYGETEKE